ncbi:MAG: MBL fold metallo-hydrolase [Hyphomicrobiales bacterium]|nr:MAG: MBL fold metallo-hydrolase [Hyphomicrobiales bacterium]
MILTIAGCGDAFGTEGQFNTCYHVEASRGNFLIDCGASSLVALNKLKIPVNEIGTIFISHLHGDHFGGLPFFLLHAWYATGRTEDLTLAGPPGLQKRVEQALDMFFPQSTSEAPQFALRYVELPPNTKSHVNGIDVETFAVCHFSGAPSFALRIEVDGKIVSFSGDTSWTDKLLEASAEADLHLQECYNFETVFPYHSEYVTLEKELPASTAKRILLTHFGYEMFANLDKVTWEYGRDGMVIEL